MPKADTTNTTTTPAPDLARTTPGRRGLLGGAAALLAGAAAVTLPRPVRAAGTDRDAGLLGPGAGPVLALWRHYNDLLRQQDPISDSADALRAALTARWGEAGMATLSASILWGHDPDHHELIRLNTECDRLTALITDTSDTMADTPAESIAGARAKIQLAISLCPADPDYLENCDYHEPLAKPY
jgi:hypothetical protein